ncbi:ATP synthase subunit D [Clostridium sporogenes]|uniref:ATP synthase subunit D n=1 Tax=Clostridium sporogenes TaxID=1509 RepID=A0A6B4UIR0_CLOSG|nr:ATP synthase subunit D [Clostridium sp.]NFD94113.1 ATP synthase subunit D [Clostridium sporogenes]NFE45632.1 ATP synthase subunit D [Clostridium sporogenes]NFF15450.1 ATP synthase subunit D [Clostridium sporogenes]NFF67515.1 ATP synthase subunit D [Clostridium sporogenes]
MRLSTSIFDLMIFISISIFIIYFVQVYCLNQHFLEVS